MTLLEPKLPSIPLEDRKPLTVPRQEAFYKASIDYRNIQSRTYWVCCNPACQMDIKNLSYYWKYKGSRSYWNMTRHQLWDRVCEDCYVDHILNPDTSKWRAEMESRLRRSANRMETIIDRLDLPRHAMKNALGWQNGRPYQS